jgi:hypothetical protein
VRPARQRRTLGGDDAGSFPVLEAILVAVLVLTAILFFTSVQRPSRGSEQGGIDLAKISADTLQILRTRTFSGQSMEGWVTNVTAGDTTTATSVNDFLRQVLPAGARYSLRLDNGVSTLQILPYGATETPFEGRASEILFLPNWHTYSNSTSTVTVTPGQIVAATTTCTSATTAAVDCLVRSGTFLCYESPMASLATRDGANGLTTDGVADTWLSKWQSVLQTGRTTTNGKDNATAVGSGNQQVPFDLPLGRWQLSTAVAVSGHCTGPTVVYVNVVPPGLRMVADGSTTSSSVTVNSATGAFTAADIGRTVSGSGIPAGDRIATVVSSTQVTLATAATATATGVTLTITPGSTFTPYGLELVVWFGA